MRYGRASVASSIARRAVRRVLRALPGKARLARFVSTAPPALKTPLVCRTLTRVMEHDDLAAQSTLPTNLGFSRRRFEIATNATPNYFFGRPDSYAGEHGALLLAAQLARHSDAFVDVGAHHGYFTFYVHEQLARPIPIHFFEPDADLFAELSANVQRLALDGVYGHACALGARSGTAVFYTNLSDRSSSSLTAHFATRHRVREDRVQVRTFAEFAAEQRLGNCCVKVDVENAEHEFLAGTVSARASIRFLLIEILGPAVGSGFVRKAIEQLDMHAYYINDLWLEHSPDGAFEYRSPEYNWLFCRESPHELRNILAGTALSVREGARA